MSSLVRLPAAELLRRTAQSPGRHIYEPRPRLEWRRGFRPLPSLPPMPSASRSEEHTSELQSLMRISYAVFCLKKKNKKHPPHAPQLTHTLCISHNLHQAHKQQINC